MARTYMGKPLDRKIISLLYAFEVLRGTAITKKCEDLGLGTTKQIRIRLYELKRQNLIGSVPRLDGIVGGKKPGRKSGAFYFLKQRGYEFALSCEENKHLPVLSFRARKPEGDVLLRHDIVSEVLESTNIDWVPSRVFKREFNLPRNLRAVLFCNGIYLGANTNNAESGYIGLERAAETLNNYKFTILSLTRKDQSSLIRWWQEGHRPDVCFLLVQEAHLLESFFKESDNAMELLQKEVSQFKPGLKRSTGEELGDRPGQRFISEDQEIIYLADLTRWSAVAMRRVARTKRLCYAAFRSQDDCHDMAQAYPPLKRVEPTVHAMFLDTMKTMPLSVSFVGHRWCITNIRRNKKMGSLTGA